MSSSEFHPQPISIPPLKCSACGHQLAEFAGPGIGRHGVICQTPGCIHEGVEMEPLASETAMRELLFRKFHAGTRVTNCVRHMGLAITVRPDDCELCLTDLRNHVHFLVRVNHWLNQWKDDATKLLTDNDSASSVRSNEE